MKIEMLDSYQSPHADDFEFSLDEISHYIRISSTNFGNIDTIASILTDHGIEVRELVAKRKTIVTYLGLTTDEIDYLKLIFPKFEYSSETNVIIFWGKI